MLDRTRNRLTGRVLTVLLGGLGALIALALILAAYGHQSSAPPPAAVAPTTTTGPPASTGPLFPQLSHALADLDKAVRP